MFLFILHSLVVLKAASLVLKAAGNARQICKDNYCVLTTDHEQLSWSDLSLLFSISLHLRKIFAYYFFKLFTEYIVTYCYFYYEVDNMQKQWLKPVSFPGMSSKYLTNHCYLKTGWDFHYGSWLKKEKKRQIYLLLSQTY